ncbi:MAG: DNA primase [Patescibacteria group bacterium]
MNDPIEEVKRKTDIVDFIQTYVPLTRSGKNYKGLCPFHNEKTPSFMVSPQLQIFKCFGCGLGGDSIFFYSQIEGVPFGEALREMAKRAGVKLPSTKKDPQEELREKIYGINRLAADYFHYVLTDHELGKPALDFLKKRGVKKEAIEEFKLGYAPSSWDNLGRFILKKGYSRTDYLQSGLGTRAENQRGYFDFFRGRIIYPLRSATGKFAGFAGRSLGNAEEGPKYINTVETPVFEKRRYLYNFDLAKQEIKKQKTAVLVEGEMDAIALYNGGIKNVLATKGTALTPEQISYLARFAQKLVLCFDRDSAGLEATKKGIFIAQSAGFDVAAVLLPEGLDPDEALAKNPEEFKKSVLHPSPIFDFYLNSALARFDVQTPSGKKQIAGELLPVLKSLANEVEKAAYITVLSQKIGIEEAVLWRQIEKETGIELPGREVKALISPVASSRKQNYLMGILLSLPPEKVRSAQTRIALEDLSDPQLQDILTSLRSYLKQVKQFKLPNFSGKLGEEVRKKLADLTFLDTESEDLTAEFTKALFAVKRERYKKELKNLISQVRQAEGEALSKEVKRLQKAILDLTEKIDAEI